MISILAKNLESKNALEDTYDMMSFYLKKNACILIVKTKIFFYMYHLHAIMVEYKCFELQFKKFHNTKYF